MRSLTFVFLNDQIYFFSVYILQVEFNQSLINMKRSKIIAYQTKLYL